MLWAISNSFTFSSYLCYDDDTLCCFYSTCYSLSSIYQYSSSFSKKIVYTSHLKIERATFRQKIISFYYFIHLHLIPTSSSFYSVHPFCLFYIFLSNSNGNNNYNSIQIENRKRSLKLDTWKEEKAMLLSSWYYCCSSHSLQPPPYLVSVCVEVFKFYFNVCTEH